MRDAQHAIEDGNLKVIRAKRVELIEGEFVFPLQSEQLKAVEAKQVPHLDLQNIHVSEEEKERGLREAGELLDDFWSEPEPDDAESPPRGEAESELSKDGNRLPKGDVIEKPSEPSSGSKSELLILPNIPTVHRFLLVTTGMESSSLGIRKVPKDLLMFRLNSGTVLSTTTKR